MKNEAFDIKKKFGDIGEGTVGAMLCELTVEVKNERKFSDTGNVCVEYEQNDGKGGKKPSGIAATEAQWYSFRFANDAVLCIPTAKLKAIAREYWHTRRCTGDNGNMSVLIPISRLLPCQKLQVVPR